MKTDKIGSGRKARSRLSLHELRFAADNSIEYGMKTDKIVGGAMRKED